MAGTPKRKISTARQGKRRSQIKLKLGLFIRCSNCGKPKLNHFRCPHCQK
ncbi:50S ribosomal protein L32 [Candidatus Collierbacteria bacterium]|nr:50S ribosomal protein L32 [Candidatus Collierbacteria bacterium]